MQTINTINQFLTNLLMSSPVPDFGYNGIQVENTGEIKKIAFAVDVCEETIEKAIGMGLHKIGFSGHDYTFFDEQYSMKKQGTAEYFEKIQKFNANYSPERLEIFNNRVEKEIGDYLIYIIAEDADDIYDEIVDSL